MQHHSLHHITPQPDRCQDNYTEESDPPRAHNPRRGENQGGETVEIAHW